MIGCGFQISRVAARRRAAPNIDDSIAVSADDGDQAAENVLTNDPGASSVETVAGSAGNVGVATAGSAGGLFTIASNGTASFDPNGEFSLLPLGAVVTSTITYTNDLGQEGIVSATITGTLEVQMTLAPEDWGSLSDDTLAGGPGATGSLPVGTEVALAPGATALTVGAVSRTGGQRGTGALVCGSGGTIRYTYTLAPPVADFAAAVRLAPADLTAISMAASAGGVTVVLSGGTATVTLTDGSGTWSASRPYSEIADSVVIGFRVQAGVLGVLVDGDDAADEATDDLTGYDPGIAQTLDIGAEGATIYGGSVQSSASISAAALATIIANLASDHAVVTEGSSTNLTFSDVGSDRLAQINAAAGSLVVATAGAIRINLGGGGGAGGPTIGSQPGGGGGAGEHIDRVITLPAGTYALARGAGGQVLTWPNATGGADTTISIGGSALLTAKGGGRGGRADGGDAAATAGGSGGGGGASGGAAGATTAVQGYGFVGALGGTYQAAGGGGGAGAAGSLSSSGNGGAAGAGRASDISGTTIVYCGGGGGGGITSGGVGGSGGGGAGAASGATGAAGQNGRGAGGGGASNVTTAGAGPGGYGFIELRWGTS